MAFSVVAAKRRHISLGCMFVAVIHGTWTEFSASKEREGHGTHLYIGHLTFSEQTEREMINISKLEGKLSSTTALQMF